MCLSYEGNKSHDQDSNQCNFSSDHFNLKPGIYFLNQKMSYY